MNKDRGILLMCHGSAIYGKFAHNMAHSIKHWNKTFPIHLICDHISIGDIDTSIFDSFEIIDFLREDKKDYCLSKIRLFERSPFNKTLYLDVDGVCLNNPEEVFTKIENEHFIYSQVMGSGGINDSISYNPWASNDVIWKKFNLSQDAVYPTLQTSILYFDKSTESESFFNQLKNNYALRLKETEYLEMWGKSKQHPDELYYSITMAQLGIVPTKSIQPVFFPNRHESITTIERDYLILALYGASTLIKPYAKNLYDGTMQRIMNAKGREHRYKSDHLYRGKFHTK